MRLTLTRNEFFMTKYYSVKMIPTVQHQILINIGRINHIICIICGFFSTPFCLGAFLSSFSMTFFTLLLVPQLLCNAGSKLNHWDSSQKWYFLLSITTKNVTCKRLDKTSIVGTGLMNSN